MTSANGEPALLVLDEPERRLDTGMRGRLASRLAGQRDAGVALLFATHDPDLLRAVADEVLLLGDEEAALLEPDAAADLLGEL
jgi:ABC-type Mn2+/Zn2+ transport system ATPase subunit